MSSTPPNPVQLSLLAAVAVLALQACGDDEAFSTTGDASSTASTGASTTTSSGPGATTGATASASSGSGQGGNGQGGSGQGGSGQGGDAVATSGSGGGDGGSGQGGQGQGGQGQGGTGGTLDCSSIPSTDIPGDHCDAVAAAFCANLESCHNFIFTLLVGTEAECLLFFRQNCEHELLLPGQTATADELEACAEVVVNAPCGCSTEEICGGGDGLGTLAEGSACEVDTQCQSGFCDTHGDDCGLCLTTVPTGGSCAGEHEHCADDHYCDPADDICRPEKPTGSACLENYECMTGTTDSNDKCADGVCGTGLEEGESCVEENDDACQGTLFCQPGTATCEPLALNGQGEPCGYDLGTMTIALCQGDMVCSAQIGGTCEPRKTLDEECTLSDNGDPDDFFDHDCLPHLSCTADTCQVTADVTCR